jgi:hypothetical protein
MVNLTWEFLGGYAILKIARYSFSFFHREKVPKADEGRAPIQWRRA